MMQITRKQLEAVIDEVGPAPSRITMRRGLPGEDEIVVVTGIESKPEPEYSEWGAKVKQRAIEKYGAAS